MARTRFKILYVGRRPAVPTRFLQMFESAGYLLAREKNGARRHGRDGAVQAIVSEGLRPAELTRALHRAGMASPKLHVRVFTAEPIGPLRSSAPSSKRQSARVNSISLQALRESVGRTQGDVARKVSMTQPQLSRVEARRDHLTSTLRKYVRALGGKVEVVAVMKGRRLVLQDV
jgi:hypothetical protein